MRWAVLVSGAISLGLSTALAAPPAMTASQPALPLGHPDFYPSADRPVGWRGDGSGAWPGARPVDRWNAATGENIVWKVPMPGPSFAQPVVVGDKVFALADPNWLICVSAADGTVLWQKAVDPFEVLPTAEADAGRKAVAFWDATFRLYSVWLDAQRFPDSNAVSSGELTQANQAAQEHGFGFNKTGQANFDMLGKTSPLRQRLNEDQARFSLYYFGHWEGILTHTFATPVSDGQCIYVTMANDQVACYDLSGNRRWLIRDRPAQAKPSEMHVRYAMSPLLVGDKLIVAACGELRAYDKATGRKLWSVFNGRDFGGAWSKVGSPVNMRVMANGRPLDLVLSPGSGIYRATDGKLVGSLPKVSGYEGSTALVAGDLYIRKGAPDSGVAVRLCCRVVARSEDEVVCEEVWKNETRTGNATDVLHQGVIYSPQNGTMTEVATGKEQPMGQAKTRNCSPALGGDQLVVVGPGTYGDRDRDRERGVASAGVIRLGSPATVLPVAKAFVDQRYLEDAEYRLKWRWRGNGDALSNSSPCFAGNRLFFRTAGYLWCVGDPRQPWVTGKNTPPEARAAR